MRSSYSAENRGKPFDLNVEKFVQRADDQAYLLVRAENEADRLQALLYDLFQGPPTSELRR